MTTYRNLHRFAVFTAFCTFLLIIAGGLVTSTQSGLSVPDWPTTYGRFMFAYPLDEMVGGIFYEHTHRMIASFVGFLTVILAAWLWRREDRRWVCNLGFVALAAVIAQGILGGLTVRFLLPTPISVSHATLAQTFFAIVASIALFTSQWWQTGSTMIPQDHSSPNILTLLFITASAVYVQLVIGALMRHTQSGLVIPDFPLAYGQFIPSLSSDAIAEYNRQLIQSDIRIAADGPITSSQIIIHLIHRLWGGVTGMLVVWTSIRLLRISHTSKRIARLAYALLILVIVQIALGAFTVLSRKGVDITTAHVATGAVLLVTCVFALLHVARMSAITFPRFAFSAGAKEATT